MIDWLTVRAWLGLSIDAGRVMSVTADGEIEWQCPKRLQVVGSHEASVTLRNCGHDGSVEFSGNPAKWFQGHNLFGSDDLAELVPQFVRSVCDRIGYRVTAEDAVALDAGMVKLTRIDCTEAYDFGTRPRALAAVRAMSELSHFKHRGRGSLLAEGTVMWRKGSRRMSGKAYAKGLELVKHPIPLTLQDAERLTDLAQGHVRFEFTLRAMWLKREGLELVCNWARVGATPQGLHARLMADLDFSEAAVIDSETLPGLSPRLQLAYDAWAAGKDLRAMLPARTFYRYRRQLLPHGVDLALVRPRKPESNVVPLRVVLTGTPVQVPAWAKGTPLYFEPRAA